MRVVGDERRVQLLLTQNGDQGVLVGLLITDDRDQWRWLGDTEIEGDGGTLRLIAWLTDELLHNGVIARS